MKVGIVGGLGRVGLIHSAGLAGLGHDTISYDLDQGKVRRISNGSLPFHEPGLEVEVRKGIQSGRLAFSSDIRDLEGAEVVLICVGTPSLPSGRADASAVKRAVLDTASGCREYTVIAIKSTVPVGTARRLTRALQRLGRDRQVEIVSNPEFLREGSGVRDFQHPDRTVIGANSQRALDVMRRLLAAPGVPLIETSWENAELIKYASNAFLATKISFINEMAQLSERVGGDIMVIARGMGLDPRIGPHFLEAGGGFSGPCLEKDLKALIYQQRQAGSISKLTRATLAVNLNQRADLIGKLRWRLDGLRGRNIAVLGLAFKPETDDVRNSHSLSIIDTLLLEGAAVTVYDPRVRGANEPILKSVAWAGQPYDAAAGQDALLILTAWPEFLRLDFGRIRNLMRRPVIVDGRNMFDPLDMRCRGFDYHGVGRGRG